MSRQRRPRQKKKVRTGHLCPRCFAVPPRTAQIGIKYRVPPLSHMLSTLSFAAVCWTSKALTSGTVSLAIWESTTMSTGRHMLPFRYSPATASTPCSPSTSVALRLLHASSLLPTSSADSLGSSYEVASPGQTSRPSGAAYVWV